MSNGRNRTWWAGLVAATCVGAATPGEGAMETKQVSFGAVSCAVPQARVTAPGSLAVRTGAVSSRRGAAARPAAQVTRNDRADITFEVGPAAAGAVEVRGQRSDFVMKKTQN